MKRIETGKSGPRRGRRSLTDRLSGRSAQFAVAGATLAVALLLGGGSRADIVSLTFLRPLAILAFGYAMIVAGPGALVRLGTPAWLLGAVAALTALQLVPLPYGMWSALPGRQLLADHDNFLFATELWRPLTLSPSGTWNALFALGVPLAVMATCAPLDQGERRRLLSVVMALVALNILIAALQSLGPSRGPLHFFRITNYNNPVGLFSNRNHMAIFLASVLPLVVYGALASTSHTRRRPLIIAAAVAGAMGILVIVLASGSRAGTLLLALSLVGTAVLWLVQGLRNGTLRSGRAKGRRLLAFGIAATLAIATALAVMGTSRSTSIDRLMNQDLETDLRVQVTPQLWQMLTAYFPFGSGFGTFAKAYAAVEPFDMLRPTYLNQAHNDFLQFPIEGGLIAILLMIVAGVWFVSRGWRAATTVWNSADPRAALSVAPFAWLALAVLFAGSVGDYPMRTPAIMAWAALIACLLSSVPDGSDAPELPGSRRSSKPSLP